MTSTLIIRVQEQQGNVSKLKTAPGRRCPCGKKMNRYEPERKRCYACLEKYGEEAPTTKSSKQDCASGHDTHACGRDSNGWCLKCKREAQRKNKPSRFVGLPRLREVAEEQGMNHVALARKAGLSRTTVGRVWKGRGINRGYAQKLAETLGLESYKSLMAEVPREGE